MSISLTPDVTNIKDFSYGATTLFNATTTGGTTTPVLIEGNASAFVSVDTGGNNNTIFKLEGTVDGTKWWTLRGLDYESGLIDGQFQGDRSIHYNISGLYQVRGNIPSMAGTATVKMRYQASEVSIGSPQVSINNTSNFPTQFNVFGPVGYNAIEPNGDGSLLIGDGLDLLAINTDGSINALVSGTYSNNADNITPDSTNQKSLSFLYGFDGTSWDRLRLDGSNNLNINLNASGITLNTRMQVAPTSNTWFTGATAAANGTGYLASNNNYMALRITPTSFTGTIQWQWSIDNVTWNNLYLTSAVAGTWPYLGTATPVTSIAISASSTVLLYHGLIPPNAYIRANISAYTSGSVTVAGSFLIQNQILPTSSGGQNLRVQLASAASEISSFGTGDTVTPTSALGAGMYAMNSAGTMDRLRTSSIGDSGSSLGLLATAGYLFNGATQFDRARSMLGVTTDTTTGIGIAAVGLMGFDGTSYGRIRTVGGVGDGATLGLAAQGGYGWNGAGWDKLRANNIHKYQEYLSLTNGQHLEIWTPASGKKFRLMNVLFSSNYATGARVTLRDSVGGTTTGAANLATFNFNAKDTTSFQFGPNGYLSYQANNRLAVYNDSGATVSVWLTFIGTEE